LHSAGLHVALASIRLRVPETVVSGTLA